MKLGLILLMIISWTVSGSCAAQDQTPALIIEDGLLLPGFRQSLWAGMSLKEILLAFPDSNDLAIEELTNHAMFCEADAGFPITLLLVADKLLDLRIRDAKPGSEIGTWFAKQVNSFPPESIIYETTPLGVDSSLFVEEWRTQAATWRRVPMAKSDLTNYFIEYSTDLTTLPDGMIIRDDLLLDSLNEEIENRPRSYMDVPPQPIKSPQPSYPPTSQKMGKTGKVVVQLLLDTQGNMLRWKFAKIEPIGYGFAQEVEHILLDWTFKPATLDGHPVAIWITIPFNFKFTNRVGNMQE